MKQYLEDFQKTDPYVNATKPQQWLVSAGSGKGLVLSGNKPLPDPVLTKIDIITVTS